MITQLAKAIRKSIVAEMRQSRGDWCPPTLSGKYQGYYEGRMLADGTISMKAWGRNGHGKPVRAGTRRFRLTIEEIV